MKHAFVFAVLLAAAGCATSVPSISPPVILSAPDAEKLRAEALSLLAKLGDDDWRVREDAQKRLEAMPTAVLDAVKAALERTTDAEIKIQGTRIIELLEERRKIESGSVVINSIGMRLVLIPAGEFLMGSPETEKERSEDESPQHKVKITKAFYMGETEVKQAEWKAVMGENPSNFKGDDLPVENVSWNDCQEFIKKLSAKEGKTYRLPTEAEWEFACRAGTTTPFNTGETISTNDANYDGRAVYGEGKRGEYRQKTTLVASFKPNVWGLYDMHGNAWEWCQDWYGEDYYKNSPAADPTGPETGASRVLRGGSWDDDPWNCRSAYRFRFNPGFRNNDFGFRLVLVFSPRTP
jgi:formylglycine-generating enzyme required for sulfatase activity